MDVATLLATLHPLERAVLPFLSKCKDQHGLQKASGMQEVEVVRALQWLDNKGLIKIRHSTDEIISLGGNGKEYLVKRLPELRFLSAVIKSPLAMSQVAKAASLDQAESNACLGMLKRVGFIIIDHGMVSATSQGKAVLDGSYPPQVFLSSLGSSRSVASFSPDELKILADFKSRKEIVDVKFERTMIYDLTAQGKQLAQSDIKLGDVIDRVSSEHLAQGSWKGKVFRKYDVSVNVPLINIGRRHHYKGFLDLVRQKFTALGFKEMHGPIVENEFWDMDALFMPQFHSARQIHQAYNIKEPKVIPVDPVILAKVRACHESGGETGSKGWGYHFDSQRTLKTLLRTQGTACSARMLASGDLQVPGKYFGITKNFRYDVIDATHLPDFYQTEGIVVEEGLTFGHLKGILQLFASEFAHTDKIKLKPGYFPFTEPSVELHAKHPDLGWIELGGAGMFRPELLEPFGVKVPVIAWGMGIDRIGMFNLGIKDIRDLYSHDLEVLRKARMP